MKKIKSFIKWGLIVFGILLIVLIIAGVSLVFFRKPDTKVITHISGEYMMQEINSYRQDKGLSELLISTELCDEISSRAIQKVENPTGNGHEGFDAWHQKVAPDWNIGELIFTSNGSLQPEAVIYGWKDSPSHKLILEDTRSTHICVYVVDARANERGDIISPQVVVAELGWK